MGSDLYMGGGDPILMLSVDESVRESQHGSVSIPALSFVFKGSIDREGRGGVPHVDLVLGAPSPCEVLFISTVLAHNLWDHASYH